MSSAEEEHRSADGCSLPFAKWSLVVTGIAIGWFAVEVAIARSWQDALVLHDAGFAIATVAGVLALLSFRDGGSRRRTSQIAVILGALAAAFYLFVVPL